MKKTLFNIKTGQEVTVEAVDGVEYLKTGGWSEEKPEIKKPMKKVVTDEHSNKS